MSRLDAAVATIACLSIALVFLPQTLRANPEEEGGEETYEPSDPDRPENLIRRPTIGLQYGVASIDRDGFESTFGNAGLMGVQIGFRHALRYREQDGLIQHRFGGVSASLISTELSTQDPKGDELETDLWRFGLVNADGHGYRLNRGKGSIAPYNERSMGWSFFDLRDTSAPPATGADSTLIETFEDQARFGILWKGGVRVAPTELVGLDLGYERSLLFPHTKVWYTILSMGIEEVALGAVDHFIEEIAETSPAAVPVVEFLLKGGISYALFELRTEKMNWPFDSAAPLSYETFTIGMTTTF